MVTLYRLSCASFSRGWVSSCRGFSIPDFHCFFLSCVGCSHTLSPRKFFISLLTYLSTGRTPPLSFPMGLFLTFSFWLFFLIAAVVIADWSVDGLSSNSIESSSEAGNSDQQSLFDDGFNSELLIGTSFDCALDSTQLTGKLRARSDECLAPKTPDDGEVTLDTNGNNGNGNGNGKNGNNGNGKNRNGNNGNGNGNGGRNPIKYPDSFEWRPRPLNIPLTPEPNDLCPRTDWGTNQFTICHEGSRQQDIMGWGARIENAIRCMLFLSFFSTRKNGE